MRAREQEPEIRVDINWERVREIVTEAIRMIDEWFSDKYPIDKEKALAQLEAIIKSNQITTQFFIPLGNLKMPDLALRVDPRRRKVLCKSSFRKKVAKINHFMRIL